MNPSPRKPKKEEKPIQECNKEAMWDDDVRTFFRNTARNKDKKRYVFFFYPLHGGGERECSSESQKSLGGDFEAAMNQTKD